MEKKNLDTNEALKAYAKAEFDKVDLDKKGFISTSDFADIILATRQKAGLPPLNNLELGKIMKSVDPQGTGKVTFEMWFKFLRMGKRVADTANKQQKEKQDNK
jgi:Ca2+-binding EF-hand superfamily protein